MDTPMEYGRSALMCAAYVGDRACSKTGFLVGDPQIPLCTPHAKRLNKQVDKFVQKMRAADLMDERLPPYPREGEGWHIYFLHNVSNARVKIGRSKTPDQRVRDIRNQAGIDYPLMGTVPEERFFAEEDLHTRYHDLRIMGEWFETTPSLMEAIERLTQTSSVS